MGAEDLPRRATRASSGIVQPKVPFDPDPEPERRRVRPSGSPAKASKTKEDTVPRKPPPKVTGNKDVFCWVCHKEGPNLATCVACPRAFHRRCAKLPSVPEPVSSVWACPECHQRERAEAVDSRSNAMRTLDAKALCDLLRHTLERLRSVTSAEHFEGPVDLEEYPSYRDFVVHPLDLQTIENNIASSSYHCTEAFIADVRWLLHNSYVFNAAHSPLTSTARSLLKAAKSEIDEIESCPGCYEHANTMLDDEWFGEPCCPPHILVWAKVLGWPYWPGKILKVILKNGEELVDIRFFGDHNKANVPLDAIYLLTKAPPTTSRSRPTGFITAIKELKNHIRRLEARYGTFVYKKSFENYDPGLHDSLLHSMLPKMDSPGDMGGSLSPSPSPSPSPKRRRSVSPAELPAILSTDQLSTSPQQDSQVNSPEGEKEKGEEDCNDKNNPATLERNVEKLEEEPKEETRAEPVQPLRGLKVKPQEELLSPAALNQMEGVVAEQREKNDKLRRVDDTLTKVIAGNFTVKPKLRPLKRPRPAEPFSSDEDEEPQRKEACFEVPICKSRPTRRGAEGIADVSDWAKSPQPLNNGIIDALDALIVVAKDGADADLVSKVRSLVNIHRQEMAHLYSKIREEASELCEVMGLEAEALERERDEIRDLERHLKLTMWCAMCLKEAKFYCCWGTSYCSEECQKSDWAEHYNVCKQRNSNNADRCQLASNRTILPKPLIPKPSTIQKRQVFRVVGEGSSVVATTPPGMAGSSLATSSQNRPPVAIPVKRAIPGAKPIFRVVNNSDSSSILDRGRFVLASSASSNPSSQSVVIGQAAGTGNKFFLIKKTNQQKPPSTVISQPLKVLPPTN